MEQLPYSQSPRITVSLRMSQIIQFKPVNPYQLNLFYQFSCAYIKTTYSILHILKYPLNRPEIVAICCAHSHTKITYPPKCVTEIFLFAVQFYLNISYKRKIFIASFNDYMLASHSVY